MQSIIDRSLRRLRTDHLDLLLLHSDGRDVEIRDLVVANHNWDESEVTFTGFRDGNEVGSLTLTVFGDELSTGQHVSLSSFGLVDQIRVEFTPTDFDYDPLVDQPKLKFDDFMVVA